jgi:hypothetical protein
MFQINNTNNYNGKEIRHDKNITATNLGTFLKFLKKKDENKV